MEDVIASIVMSRESDSSKQNLLSKLYYDRSSPSGYSSPIKLFKAAKEKNKSITRKDVEHFWSTEKVPSRFSLAKKKFPRATFVSRRAHHTYLADLADFSKLYKSNGGYKWLLVVQDLFSRKLIGLVAQKRKTAKETSQSLDKLFTEAPRTPKKFLTDNGGEFLRECKAVYQKYAIHHYTTNDVTQKVAPVERAILVVKQRLFKIMARERTMNWVDKLQDALTAYNKSHNRNLGMTPREAEKRENQGQVFYNTVTKAEKRNRKRALRYKFTVGQVVRILRDQTYLKSFRGNYSNMLYRIVKREMKSGGIPIYRLHELLTDDPLVGIFYGQELKPVTLDESKLPEVDAIHNIRLRDEADEVLISYKDSPNKRVWVLYDNLIPYVR